MNENFNNSRTIDDTDMKLGPVTKLENGNTRTLKKFDDDVMPENCDVIVSFGGLLKIWNTPEAEFWTHGL